MDIRVGVNQFRVQNVTGKDVYQYDVCYLRCGVSAERSLLTSGKVAIRPEPKGGIVYKKAWATKMFQGKLAQQKGPWLHDTRKLAW